MNQHPPDGLGDASPPTVPTSLSPAVRQAITALDLLGVQDRASARVVLRVWSRLGELDESATRLVLIHYPDISSSPTQAEDVPVGSDATEEVFSTTDAVADAVTVSARARCECGEEFGIVVQQDEMDAVHRGDTIYVLHDQRADGSPCGLAAVVLPPQEA